MWMIMLVHWLHVFLGIFWFGSLLYVGFVLVPSLRRLPLEQQRTIPGVVNAQAERVLFPIAILVVILGLVQGTILGPVRSLGSLLGTAYGFTFLVAALVAVATVVWGSVIVTGAIRRLEAFPLEGVRMPGSKVALDFAAQMQRVRLFVLIELLGFLVIFTCMILMRFGL
jgi:uncharacterized membrane protein